VIGVKTHRGAFRIHLAGETTDLQAVAPILDDLAGMSDSPEDFLDRALSELASHNVVLVETFDISPKAPALGLVERVRLISREGIRLSSYDCFTHLLVTFQAAEPGELDELLRRPEALRFVTDYVRSVLDDLDEQRAEAIEKMREAMGSTVGYAVLGPPDDGGT
jgi:hypothetical protein